MRLPEPRHRYKTLPLRNIRLISKARLFRRMVTFLIIAPYKYSYTYLLISFLWITSYGSYMQ